MTQPTPDVQRAKAFTAIISTYQEKVQCQGFIPAMNYGQGAEQGKSTNTGRSSVVKPSMTDFTADVELCARRALSSGHLAYFLLYYKPGTVIVEDRNFADTEYVDEALELHIASFPERLQLAVKSLDNKVRMILGRELIDASVYPLQTYLAAVDIGAKHPKPYHRFSHLY